MAAHKLSIRYTKVCAAKEVLRALVRLNYLSCYARCHVCAARLGWVALPSKL